MKLSESILLKGNVREISKTADFFERTARKIQGRIAIIKIKEDGERGKRPCREKSREENWERNEKPDNRRAGKRKNRTTSLEVEGNQP
jgi:hypothetical protein